MCGGKKEMRKSGREGEKKDEIRRIQENNDIVSTGQR